MDTIYKGIWLNVRKQVFIVIMSVTSLGSVDKHTDRASTLAQLRRLLFHGKEDIDPSDLIKLD